MFSHKIKDRDISINTTEIRLIDFLRRIKNEKKEKKSKKEKCM